MSDNPPPPASSRTAPYSVRDAEILADFYKQGRIEHQLDYYTKRIEEYNYNSNCVFGCAVLLVGFAAMAVILNTLSYHNPYLAVFAMVLPLLAAVCAAWENIYDWNKQSIAYEETKDNLEVRKTDLEENRHRYADDYAILWPDMVALIEETLGKEVGQWGQAILSLPRPVRLTIEQLLNEEREAGRISADEQKAIKKILAPIAPEE